MGVAAGHLDWTMVPYVRKSFYKHYFDGLEYLDDSVSRAGLNSELSIEAEEYKRSEKAFRYAMKKTRDEVYQAVEAMYHNLNSLMSRSGN